MPLTFRRTWMSMERCIATLIALSFILLSPTAETAFSADKADKLTHPHGLGSAKHDFHALLRRQGARLFPRRRIRSRADRHAGDPNHSGNVGEQHAIRLGHRYRRSAPRFRGADIKVTWPLRTGRHSILSPSPTFPAFNNCAGKKSAPAASALWRKFSRAGFYSP